MDPRSDGLEGHRPKDSRNIRLLLVLFIVFFCTIPVAVSGDNYVGGLPLETVQDGIVSGGVYMDADNTWWPSTPGPQDVEKDFSAIPEFTDIEWARLYVAVYVGHMQNNYKGTVSVKIDGDGDGEYETDLGTEDLNVKYVFTINGGNDNSAFSGHGKGEPYKMLNDHTTRVTSDYVMWYDVTDDITAGNPAAHVVTEAVSDSFDGRIKMITLVVAYIDGDTDEILYWVNQGQDSDTYYSDENFEEDYVGSTEFDVSDVSGSVESATLMVNHMASSDGYYYWLGDELDRYPSKTGESYFQGTYFGYDIWDLTDLVSPGDINDLGYGRSGEGGTGEYSGQFYKIPLAVLTVKQSAMVAPTAGFSADPVSGETPLTVRFTDESAGPPSSWKWEYRFKEDGSSAYGSWTQFSTEQNPSQAFTGIGMYTIRLTATNDLGSDTEIKTGYITVSPAQAPVAAFSATPTEGTAPLTVTFTDESTHSPTSWTWEFRDAGSEIWLPFSCEQDPVYIFANTGTYDIQLTAENAGGSDNETRTGYIIVSDAPPVTGFSATPRNGYVPLEVNFMDESTGSITGWAWDFGNDGTVDSTEQNPVYSYTTEGVYTVSLTTTGPGGSDQEIKTDYITAAAAGSKLTLNANFTAYDTVVNIDEDVVFTDKSSGIVTNWAWDFESDGHIDSTVQDPVTRYAVAGTYSVTLEVTGPEGTSKLKRTDYIKVRGDPTCDLTIIGAINPVNLGATVFAKEPNIIRVIDVSNNGPSASPETTLRLVSSDGYTSRATVPPIASGGNVTITVEDPAIRKSAGAAIRYNVTVDPDDEVSETSETNNYKLSADKTVTYNGYKGKRFQEGGDVDTRRTYDLHGGLVHSFGDSKYRSGSFGGSGWTSYTITWSASDLVIPTNATIKKAILYVPYTWDNSKEADTITINFNGEDIPRSSWYKDRSNFGAYTDHDYGLQTYDVTDAFDMNAKNTAIFTRASAGAKLSTYGFTLAVIYEDPAESRKQIFMNEEFDILGADETSYATTEEEATAYIPFSGQTIDPNAASEANLITFVASGDGEGNLFFNGARRGGGWDFGSMDGPQVAVDSRDVIGNLKEEKNIAAIQSTQGDTTCMGAIQQFLIVNYGEGTNTTALVANFTAEPLTGIAPLLVNFTDTSEGKPDKWVWDFENDNATDATRKNPDHTYTRPGNYTVSLTVKNATASSSINRTGYILVLESLAETTTPLPVNETRTGNGTQLQVAQKPTAFGTTIANVTSTDTPVDPAHSPDLIVHITGFFHYVADKVTGLAQSVIQTMTFSGGTGLGT